jgi:HPt (histidine-containing phosphotransfer) domain-containing protein
LRTFPRPVYLPQIKAKLLANEYRSISDWKSDIQFIWQTAHRFHGSDSVLGIVATEFRDYFHELTQKPPSPPSVRVWCTTLRETCKEMDELLAHRPIIGDSEGGTSIHLEKITKMSSKEADRLIATAGQLHSRKDAQEMFRIIRKFQANVPILSRDVTVDLVSLEPVVLRSLESYVRKRFRELGKTFPSD